MVKKIGDKKVSTIKSTTETSNVEKTAGVSKVREVAPASAVGGVGRAGAISGKKRRATRIMTLAEREELFKMISEEADQLFKSSGILNLRYIEHRAHSNTRSKMLKSEKERRGSVVLLQFFDPLGNTFGFLL